MSNARNATLKALVDGVIAELMIKTKGDQVYLDETTTLSPKIAEMVAAINLRAKSTDVTQQIDDLRQELLGDVPVEAYNTFTELAAYIEEHEEASEALTAAIGNKADKSVVDDILVTISTLGALAEKDIVTESDLDPELVEMINSGGSTSHTHSNKDILDDITAEDIENWNAGGNNEMEITYADYVALSDEEQSNGTTYYISDGVNTDISTILDTMEEIEANTEENKIAGALAVKEGFEHSKLKLLWENPTPTYTFSAQNITLASDNYDYLDIYWLVLRKGAGTDMVLCEKTIKGYSSLLRLVSHMDSMGYYMFSRTISYVNDTTLNFSDTVCTIEGVTSTPNVYIVPIKIYGGKF